MPSVFRSCYNILRKRYILALIFSISAIYCVVRLIIQTHLASNENFDIIHGDRVNINWNSIVRDEGKLDDKNLTSNSKKLSTCRNSVQGKVFIADDRGYICLRHDRLSSGCCKIKAPNTKRYSCETCEANQCCAIYECCISCCLHPNKKTLLQQGLGRSSKSLTLLFSSLTDHFELCLFKCRTSSQSVQHENSYRDPKAKHCYGNNPPFMKNSNNL